MDQLREGIGSIHAAADVALANEPKACSKGCWHCCRQLIRVHAAEELPITDYIKKNFSSELRRRVQYNLQKWFQTLEANTPPKELLSEEDVEAFGVYHMKNGVRCPFLVDGACSIYPVRPTLCRTFYVKDRPEDCEANPARIGEMKGYEAGEKAIHAIADLADGVLHLRLLPYAVAEFFGLNLSLKKMLKIRAFKR